jgi:hypothetical protein
LFVIYVTPHWGTYSFVSLFSDRCFGETTCHSSANESHAGSHSTTRAPWTRRGWKSWGSVNCPTTPGNARNCDWAPLTHYIHAQVLILIHIFLVSKVFVRFIRCLYTRSKIICFLLFINIIIFLSISDDFVTDHDGITASSLTYKNLTLPLKHLSYEELLTDMISSATITLVYFQSFHYFH